MRTLTPFSGVVLAGGDSRRMGTDKALVPLVTSGHPDGAPLVCNSRDALRGAGAYEVLSIGGDAGALAALGFTVVPDDFPGAGPLGGLITALRCSSMHTVVVLTCDLPEIDPASVRGLVQGLDGDPEAVAAVARRDGRRQVLTAAYRRSVLPDLERRFAAGERSVRRALDGLDVAVVDHLDPRRLVDLDSPEAVEHYAAGADPDDPSPGP